MNFTSLAAWRRCGGRYDPCVFNAYVDSRYQNSHCVTQGSSDRATCKCNNGYFGQPKWDGRCMKLGKQKSLYLLGSGQTGDIDEEKVESTEGANG